MCTHPIVIKNKSKHFDPRFDRKNIIVPCGYCSQCIANKKREWQIRSYFEYIYTIKQGGFALLDTYTYKPEFCPDINGFLTFDREHYKRFMKNLRQKMVDKGYDISGKFKVLWTSEYGGQYKRPHYHAVFFSTVKGLTPQILSNFCREAWSFYNPKTKKYINIGRCDVRPVSERLVNHVKGIYYVLKYMFKDLSFSIEFAKQKDARNNRDFFDLRLAEINFKRYRPFFRVSQGFGLEAFKSVFESDKDLILSKHLVRVPFYTKTKGEVIKEVPIPQYYLRKMFCDFNKEDKTYSVNLEYINSYVSAKYEKVDKLSDCFHNILDNLPFYYSFLTTDIKELLSWKIYNDKHVNLCVSDIQQYIRHSLFGVSLHSLAFYQVFLEGRSSEYADLIFDYPEKIINFTGSRPFESTVMNAFPDEDLLCYKELNNSLDSSLSDVLFVFSLLLQPYYNNLDLQFNLKCQNDYEQSKFFKKSYMGSYTSGSSDDS